MRSNSTPYWVKLLRQNLVATIITGEVLRLDDFETSVRFLGISEGDNEGKDESDAVDIAQDQHEEEQPSDSIPDGDACPEDSTAVTGITHRVVRDRVNGGPKLRHLLKKTRNLDTMPSLSRDQDEMRMSASTRGLHLNNREGRIYTFGKIDAQLRRNWTAERGTFVMVAEECRWIMVPCRSQMDHVPSWWT